MTTIDFRGERAQLVVTAGDSVNLTCTVDEIVNLTNPVFSAAVKDNSGNVVATFTSYPTVDGAVLVLTPAQTRELSELDGEQQVVVGGGGVTELWHGRYDVQLAHEPNVVRTFLRGPMKIEGDVTP